jgi:uncharacterized protein (UPF0335 family)
MRVRKVVSEMKDLDMEIRDLVEFYKSKGRSVAFIRNEVEIKKLSAKIAELKKDDNNKEEVESLDFKLKMLLDTRRNY